LEKRESRPHKGTRGKAGSLNPYHTKLVKEIIDVSPGQRRPAEYLPLSGAGSRQRFLGGVPFLIKLGVVEGIEEPEEPEATAECVPSKQV
jgi:hypothetical protein